MPNLRAVENPQLMLRVTPSIGRRSSGQLAPNPFGSRPSRHTDVCLEAIRGPRPSTGLSPGTSRGPHVIRDGERPAWLCTLSMAPRSPQTARDLLKCVTAASWASSGRRFKSCQADTCQADTVRPTQCVTVVLGAPAGGGRGDVAGHFLGMLDDRQTGDGHHGATAVRSCRSPTDWRPGLSMMSVSFRQSVAHLEVRAWLRACRAKCGSERSRRLTPWKTARA